MKLAVLKGNRFNPWHLRAFNSLRGDPAVTAFRADSEIQRVFSERDDSTFPFDLEPIYFDTDTGSVFKRFQNRFTARFFDREPQIVPFHDRLAGFDLVQSWELFTDWTAEAIEAREKYGVPLALMIWDNIPFNMERNPKRRHMKERAAAVADRFLVHTERSRRTLDMEGVPEDRIVQINPGVDTDLFSPGTSERARLGLDDEEFIILFVGWLLPRKGLDFLILALRELVHDPSLRDYRFRLAVVGEGAGKDRVEELVRRVELGDHCSFLGSFPYGEMPAVFRSADAFVLPSIAMTEWQEQFGMSLIEALACGIPVVSTYSGAIPEIAGDAALLCQPNDFLSLYEALKELAGDPALREELGAKGRARAVERFGLQQFADALSDVYESMLS